MVNNEYPTFNIHHSLFSMYISLLVFKLFKITHDTIPEIQYQPNKKFLDTIPVRLNITCFPSIGDDQFRIHTSNT